MATLTSGDLDFVSHVPGLDVLKRETLERVIAPARIARHAKGQSLFHQGDVAAAFFIIVHGWVKLYRINSAGQEAVIDVATSRESLAVVAAFTGQRHPATAETVSDACVVRIPVIQAVGCMREIPEVTLALMGMTFQHLHRATQQIEQLKTKSGLQRVARFIASLCPTDAGPCVVALPYNKLLLAGHLGITPESLSRAFARLKAIGVTVHASSVAVNDVGKLRQVATDDRQMPPFRNHCEMQAAKSAVAD